MSLDPTSSDDKPSDAATSIGLPTIPLVDPAFSFTSVVVSHHDSSPSSISLPPIKRQRTDDALVDSTLASLPQPLSPPPAILSAIVEPLDSLLALPIPSADTAAAEDEETDEQRRSRRRDEKRRRRRRDALEAAGGADDEYQPMALGLAGEEEDDEMTLLMDDMQRVEGEEEDELRALQADAELDIEQLRQQMRQAEQDEPEDDEGGEEEEEEEEGSEYSDEEDEDRIDINDLPRLKDLQALQHAAVAAGLPPPTTLLDPTSLNVPFPPEQPPQLQAAIVDNGESTVEERVVKVESVRTIRGEEVKVEELTFRQQPADDAVYSVVHPALVHPAVVEADVVSVTVEKEKSEEMETKQPVEEQLEEKAAEVKLQAEVEMDDVTDRERILSQELGISVAEMREMDRQYHADTAAAMQQQTARRSKHREQRADVDAQDEGYSSSSSSSSSSSRSSSSSSSHSDTDDYYESYSSTVTHTTTAYPPPHITPYPAKSSRVGPTYQAHPIPALLPTAEAKAIECALHMAEEGQLVEVGQEGVVGVAPEGDLYWEVEKVRQRRREMREEMARKRMEQVAAAAEVTALGGLGAMDGGQQPVVVEAISVAEDVEVRPVVRSQRSSARRAREFIASVAASTGSEKEVEAAQPVTNEVREVVDAVVDAIADAGAAELERSNLPVNEVETVSIPVLT